MKGLQLYLIQLYTRPKSKYTWHLAHYPSYQIQTCWNQKGGKSWQCHCSTSNILAFQCSRCQAWEGCKSQRNRTRMLMTVKWIQPRSQIIFQKKTEMHWVHTKQASHMQQSHCGSVLCRSLANLGVSVSTQLAPSRICTSLWLPWCQTHQVKHRPDQGHEARHSAEDLCKGGPFSKEMTKNVLKTYTYWIYSHTKPRVQRFITDVVLEC